MELLEEEEAAIPELKRQLETEDLGPEEKISLLNDALNKVLNSAAVQADSAALTRVKSQLYLSGVLGQCVRVLPLGRNWTSAATLAHLTSCSCVGAEPGSRSEAFHRLFLPSVMDALLSLANQLMSRAECSALFRKVMDSVGWLLSAHTHLTDQVLSSVRYEQIQMCEDVTVSLLCIQMWIQTCTVNRDFLSRLSDESVLLLLNEAVGQLALSSDSAVGGASVRLMLLMARQLGLRLQSLLLNFKGLDSLLEKDWTGRGFDQEVGQLISILQRDGAGSSESEVRFGLTRKIKEVSAERLRAACLIQAAWRSYRTRRRVKGLNRAVSTLQRRYRARRRRLQEQREAQQWEEQLSYQVCVRRQRARRRFHQKQRELLLLLPPDQVRPYLQECERRAAVAIQSAWRGFRERRRYKGAPGDALRESQRRQRAARTLQRAGRRLLEKRRAAKAPPLTPPWIGQDGLTESRRAELKQQVDEHVAVHRSTRVSAEECAALHEEVQLLLRAELQKVAQRRREEQRVEALLACARTQLELLREAPPLSTVTVKQAESFLSPSASIAARARDAHNAALQASRLPWWRTLGGMDTGEEVGPAHLQELEAELGGLFIGGSAVVRGGAEVDGAKL
ncbi:IQ calmodulin-binding motif-containing protein 1 isoform X1 [Fundulus heteroclitus]|uniref:IQ calmodulin-binding motif-containing protein 1 isoform X1 n=1 Tax=Fundulus heteroclitus TaxID=8078 RepID=UPI00165BDB11|nr:IQ calmodulin-binding motif-containing protein 1 isoform X1 [Fundulus heteroclitus]XP_035984107.1 IQ calmodulin-binding motif-containing protein 1 isoform X1 [Fundulus heteroclitus]